MIYETQRLTLKPFTKDDITDEYLLWFQDELVCKYNTHGLGKYIRKDAEKWLEESKDNIIFGIWIKSKTKVLGVAKEIHIGNISLQNINQLNRSAEFACVFGEKDYWNKGIATEALRILINHGFKKMNLNRIWTGTQAPNIGMRNVAKKLGMKEEGIFREGTFLNGRYENIHIYSILKREWEIF